MLPYIMVNKASYFDFAQFNIRLFLSQGLNMCQFAFTSA